ALAGGAAGARPALPRRSLVPGSLPMRARGPQTRAFDFAKLRTAAGSPTIRNESLTVQVTSNPSWYAVLALPYLMEYPYECSEQVFNRLYANALARHVAGSDPKIRRVFDQRKGTPAVETPLRNNPAPNA